MRLAVPSSSMPRERTSPTWVAANGPFSGSGAEHVLLHQVVGGDGEEAVEPGGLVLDADLVLLALVGLNGLPSTSVPASAGTRCA